MTVRCVSCEKFSLKDAPAMARLGFGHCDYDRAAVFKSSVFERACAKHEKAPGETESKRIEWLRKQINV
jgi:hypothetical protein